ncbi:MAG TPA: hypothetical protein VEQ42_08370 [Pyrinomonadaceae bacterium]|nr:hypothetical protein [Pyrinomonadaceae bacterium]
MAENNDDGREPSKADLQRQMAETRESISETVAEIREVVSNQYDTAVDKIETVKETVTEVLDWREKFKENPLVWGAGTLSVGVLIGLGLARGLDDSRGGKRRGRAQSTFDEVAETLISRLSGIGDAVLPFVSGQVKEMFGIDLADYLKRDEPKRLAARKRPAKKAAAAKKRPAKKRPAAKSRAK